MEVTVLKVPMWEERKHITMQKKAQEERTMSRIHYDVLQCGAFLYFEDLKKSCVAAWDAAFI